MIHGNGTVSSGRKSRISGLPPGKITWCVSMVFARACSCLVACPNRTLRWVTRGVGTAKIGRNLTIRDRQPVQVFDAVRGRAVLFGGKSETGVLNDTWEWDGQAWTQQEDAGPSPRWHHALGFDLVHNAVILFGGDPGNGTPLGDTWSWDGSNWTRIATFGANPCSNAAMVSTDVQIAMFGGMDSSNALLGATWVFDGKHWTQRQDIGPLPRYSHAMSYDTARRTIVLFGGHELADTVLGDTWEHIETDPSPPPGVNVASITVPSMSVSSGDQVVANVFLTAAAPAGTQVELSWARQGDTTHTVLSVSNVVEGDSAPNIDFIAPQVGGGGGGGGGAI
jgi:Galactose oxidase, central domain